MDEYKIGYLAVSNVILLGGATLLYMVGGRKNKAVRRFVAPVFIVLGINLSSYFMGVYSFWLLLIYPLAMGMFCLGYGGDVVFLRVWKRFLVASFSVFIGVFLCLVYGHGYWLLIVNFLTAAGTVLFAWKNPVKAAAEEVLVCLLLNGVLMFYPFLN